MPDSYAELMEMSERAAEKLRDSISADTHFMICSHFDADGLAAAGILAKSLYRARSSFHLRVLKQLDPENVDFLSKSTSGAVILADIGSGYLDLLKDLASAKDVFVFDHHQINGESYQRLIHVNPHLSNLDGGKEVSGAGVSYIVAKAMDQRNIDLSPLAVVGALGDMQDKAEGRTLHGFNSLIVEDAVKAGLLGVEKDLIIYGRETRPIHKALSHTMNPFLPGLSGQEDNCFALLSSLSIPIKAGDRWRTVVELSSDEKKNLFSAIVEKITSRGLAGAVAMNLIGSIYTLLSEEKWTPVRDAREYATLLNSCGRMDHPSVAIAVCMGERGPTIAEANTILSEHRKALATYMSLIAERPTSVESLSRLCVIHGEDYLNENMTGAVSSLLSSSETYAPGKVVVVCAKTKSGEIKISTRATAKMVEKGVNLGHSLQQMAKEYGGIGGGHKIAAGAQIPQERLSEFLKELNDSMSKLIEE